MFDTGNSSDDDDDDGQYFVREEMIARSRPTSYQSPITYCLSIICGVTIAEKER
jgi:hypothetical protein